MSTPPLNTNPKLKIVRRTSASLSAVQKSPRDDILAEVIKVTKIQGECTYVLKCKVTLRPNIKNPYLRQIVTKDGYWLKWMRITEHTPLDIQSELYLKIHHHLKLFLIEKGCSKLYMSTLGYAKKLAPSHRGNNKSVQEIFSEYSDVNIYFVNIVSDSLTRQRSDEFHTK